MGCIRILSFVHTAQDRYALKQTKVLVTGGAGYIGSHVVLQLLAAGYPVVIFDNLATSHRAALDRIRMVSGKSCEFVEGDIRDRAVLRRVFQDFSIGAVMHFAGLKAVAESESEPIEYYDNNVFGSVCLFEEMARADVKTIVFSSSATVYGDPGYSQYREDTPLAPVNVYGRTKLMVETMLRDIKQAHPCWRIALLRYFNPVGAHASGLLGEDPVGEPNNLMPLIARVAIGKREKIMIFGGDYPTHDGTALRDYIHVEDLSSGHLAALKWLEKNSQSLIAANLGTGRPYSVLEMVRAFEKASGKHIPFEVTSRRSGDLSEYYADPTLAKDVLGWEAQLGIERMCADTWRWQNENPNGYATQG